MSRVKLEQYVEKYRVPNSEVVYSSNGAKESGFYLNSRASEIASTLYLGMHHFKDKDGSIEVWCMGKMCIKI
jgi:hypothetical protein